MQLSYFPYSAMSEYHFYDLKKQEKTDQHFPISKGNTPSTLKECKGHVQGF